ncbi:hypothetical protein E2C01_056498 [Portunus trituberculatus]|uniref:Uncharacterized protein n=1 Tax=Portunus trituberculatus TaxID=210409 RepID=A0A5B7GXM4_PORTR|nr:hypothetical protein [Portunus trituberculatus]
MKSTREKVFCRTDGWLSSTATEVAPWPPSHSCRYKRRQQPAAFRPRKPHKRHAKFRHGIQRSSSFCNGHVSVSRVQFSFSRKPDQSLRGSVPSFQKRSDRIS